jgi:pullulanase/glycogen debranching enzyme
MAMARLCVGGVAYPRCASSSAAGAVATDNRRMVRRLRKTSQPPASRPFPLGAVADPGGVHFSLYSHHAQAVELLLYDEVDAAAPARVIALDPHTDRTGDYWHLRVPGLVPGQHYAWRA